MAMAAPLLLTAPSPPAPASWRRRCLLLSAPTPALRLRPANVSPAPRIPSVCCKSRARAAVARAAFAVALPQGGGEAADQGLAPDWGTLARRLMLGVLLGCIALGCGAAVAAEDSIKASGFGLRVASELRRLGWPDEAVMFTLAALPVLELQEVANDAIVAEARKQATSSSGSGQLQSFAAMFGSSGGALGNLLGGIALSYFSPKIMFLFFAILLMLQFCTRVAIPESSLKLPKATNIPAVASIRKQIKELSFALCMPEMYWSIIWFLASYAGIPFLLGTMFFYQTQVFRLDSSVIGLSKVFGQLALLAWSMAYNKYFKAMPARKVLSVLQFITTLIMLSDVLFFQGVYRKVEIPDSIYTIVFSGLLEGLILFKVLPFIVLIAKLCPSGCEGSVMAFVMSALALSTIISGYFGVALAAFMGVSGDDFSALPVCLLIEAACTMLPLYCSSLIKERKVKEKKEE